MEFELRDYIIAIMTVIMLYLLYNKYNKEHFTTTSNTVNDLKKKINDTFKVDLEPMRNLAKILTDLNNPTNTIDLSSMHGIKKLILNNLNVSKKYTTNDLITNNNVIINYDTFSKYDIDIFPRGMIIAFYNTSVPDGWVLCDGKTYYVNKNDNSNYTTTIPTNTENYVVLKTPNLIDRFILGADDKNPSGKTGGVDKVSLTFHEMPSHTHTATKLIQSKRQDIICADCDKVIDNKNPIDKTIYKYAYSSLEWNGSNEAMLFALNRQIRKDDHKCPAEPHENMPPYKRLLYIIKL